MIRLAPKHALNQQDRGRAEKQPGLATELKEANMSSVLELNTPLKNAKQPPVGTVQWLNECVELSKCGIFSETALLTPALAELLLTRNANNRPLRRAKMNQFSRDIAAGNWELNGQAIIIANDGWLNDGQHRCMAVVDSNTSVPMTFTFGPERETRLTLDQGSQRTASDFLGMEGVPNAALQAAIARMVIAYERSGGKDLNQSSYITNAEVRGRVYSDPDVAVAATFGHTNGRYSKKFLAGSIVGTCYYLLSQIDAADASKWLEQVCRGEALKLRDPAHTLRERLQGGKSSRDRKVAATLKAWNLHRRGMKVGLTHLSDEPPFPALGV